MFSNFLNSLAKKPDKITQALVGLGENPVTLVFVFLLLIGVFALISMKKIKLTTALMTQIAVSIAVAAVLNMLVIFRMPQGGSVTLASMVPIYLLALAHGPEIGMLAGLLFGMVDLFLGASIFHPLQVLLDYPLAFMFIGIAGFFPRHVNLGMFLATILRLSCHVLSGYIFFAAYAPEGTHPFIYSLLYNGSFLLTDLLIAALVMNFIPLKRLIKALNPQSRDFTMW
ncbi:MAG: energy-coupled thiamine transporter ThiT [Tissierellia bacterium]|nr:energy-coupled thiamine transporter ThiT [Tissierellia bacterium]